MTNEDYAAQIARDWNVAASGGGYVAKFAVDAEFVARFPRKIVGASMHEELWVPAAELEAFNRHIVGKIEVTQVFRKPDWRDGPAPVA